MSGVRWDVTRLGGEDGRAGLACVAQLDGYGQAGEAWLMPAPIAEAVKALPPHVACSSAQAILKKWLRQAGETEVLPPSAHAKHWSPALDAQLIGWADLLAAAPVPSGLARAP